MVFFLKKEIRVRHNAASSDFSDELIVSVLRELGYVKVSEVWEEKEGLSSVIAHINKLKQFRARLEKWKEETGANKANLKKVTKKANLNSEPPKPKPPTFEMAKKNQKSETESESESSESESDNRKGKGAGPSSGTRVETGREKGIGICQVSCSLCGILGTVRETNFSYSKSNSKKLTFHYNMSNEIFGEMPRGWRNKGKYTYTRPYLGTALVVTYLDINLISYFFLICRGYLL